MAKPALQRHDVNIAYDLCKNANWDLKVKGTERQPKAVNMHDQISFLSSSVTTAQADIEFLKSAYTKIIVMLRQVFRNGDIEWQKSLGQTTMSYDLLKLESNKLFEFQDKNAEQRNADINKLRDWVKDKVDPWEKSMCTKADQVSDALKEMDKLKLDMEYTRIRTESVMQAVMQEGKHRHSQEVDLRIAMKDQELSLTSQMRTHMAAINNELRTLKIGLEQEKAARDAANKNLRTSSI